jgi:hypothetical protein
VEGPFPRLHPKNNKAPQQPALRKLRDAGPFCLLLLIGKRGPHLSQRAFDFPLVIKPIPDWAKAPTIGRLAILRLHHPTHRTLETQMRDFSVDGFLKRAKVGAAGKKYRGRFVFPDVQWTGHGDDLLATFTVTAEEIADAADNNILYTDQEVQRGINPAVFPQPNVELSLGNGYPDTKKYIFDADKADIICEKLLNGEKLFLNPLIWNLRPGHFSAYYDDNDGDLYLYEGKIYLPDSHHRQQAIIKAVKTWRDAKKDYPRFSSDHEFKIDLYFLSRISEGDYFFEKNQQTKATARSKAFDLTTKDSLSILAKRFIDLTPQLSGNVNRVTDRLTSRNPQVATLSTVREMMKSFVGDNFLDAELVDGYAGIAARFYQMLANVRPELGHVSAADRKQSRSELLVDSGVMFHGYAELIKEYRSQIEAFGTSKADRIWKSKLAKLSSSISYRFGRWTGDLFEKANPLWREVGILKVGSNRQLTIVSSGASRAAAGRTLLTLIGSNAPANNLQRIFN